MAVDYSDKNININAIIVGFIETEMTREKIEKAAFRENWLRLVPAHHPGTPEDVGYAALFLSTDESRYICGHNLVVDGGWGIAQYA
jgi:NAD(P)-dependent dehydrogenase (short-subunit alcohol dehydrogenase family)